MVDLQLITNCSQVGILFFGQVFLEWRLHITGEVNDLILKLSSCLLPNLASSPSVVLVSYD